ncbi:S1 RNA-binding domain-containing protein [Pseudoalteromonas luteoviolacea]|uniref:S1 RNA-binding domain-containing protein n=1 Tax=Pseudoalteromonas luteoviolacea TaxID=43657 RepID=UPI001B395E95|nr:S1 RNA-binding domain-containing protein [Pseudoalteromonas luteoviolacea]
MSSVDLFVKGNYFQAQITRIEPTLEAAFVDFGAQRHGFLPLKDIEGYDRNVHKVGTELIISIEKPEYKSKGAAVKAHKMAPDGVTVHKLVSPKPHSSNGVAVFLALTLIVAAGILYLIM